MLKIAVCDDEPVFVEQISGRIKKYMPDAVIQGFFSSEELLSQKEVFDIYFLDIQMEKMNGVETAKKLRESDEECIIVFITGAKEYVFEAFDVAALHYLIKPVTDEKLQEVLKRAQKEIEKKRNLKSRQIFIKTRNKSITLNVSDILYFENEMRKILVHTVRGEISFYGVMADVEREAGEGFYRCHRGYLMNLSHVAGYDAENIMLTNEEKIYLSKNSLCMLLGKFRVQRIKRRAFSDILTISAWCIANVLIRYFVFSDSSYTLEKSLFSFVFHVCAIYVIASCFYKNRQVIHIFLTLLFIALLYVFSEIGYGVRLFLVDGLERMTWHIEAFHNVTAVKLLVDSIYCLTDIAVVALFYFSIKNIVKNHKHPIDGRNTKELIAYMLPALLGSLVSVALYFVLLMINERGHIMEYDNYQITENEEIAGYFEDMQKIMANLEQKIHTGNVVSDAVIGSKFYYAAKELKDIQLEADGFLMTDKVHVRAYDIGIILNNGLDNAIEACRKVRLKSSEKELYIKIKSFWKQKMFFIEIENSFDGEVHWGKDGFPCSTKADSEIHGIGLKNIRYCALKYGGDMDCIAEKGRFILSVMLKG